ncbi:hypothetical protein V865_007551 [Kwoniella europaea PYCC6329]|uniref:Uncharacterized protein n=1 Tax=Kwoniella europaea PYCC6329 TaxID=1423913 RepID=A0AAX4KUC6_9TREE
MSALSGDSQIIIGIDHDLPSTFIGLHTGFSERDVGPTSGRGIAKQIATICGFTKSTAIDGRYEQSLEDDLRDNLPSGIENYKISNTPGKRIPQNSKLFIAVYRIKSILRNKKNSNMLYISLLKVLKVQIKLDYPLGFSIRERGTNYIAKGIRHSFLLIFTV